MCAVRESAPPYTSGSGPHSHSLAVIRDYSRNCSYSCTLQRSVSSEGKGGRFHKVALHSWCFERIFTPFTISEFGGACLAVVSSPLVNRSILISVSPIRATSGLLCISLGPSVGTVCFYTFLAHPSTRLKLLPIQTNSWRTKPLHSNSYCST